MFGDDPRLRVMCDGDGHFCIDRDGRLFHHVLNFLRDGSPPIGLTRGLRLELLREANYYRLKDLHRALGGTLTPQEAPEGAPPLPAPKSPPRTRTAYVRSGTATGFSRPGAGVPPQAWPETATHRPLWLHATCSDFRPPDNNTRLYVRLRYGYEYSGDWVVTSPRQLPGVDYELHGACIARGPLEALNKMSQAGFLPCDDPPRAPPVDDFYTDKWVIMMYRDVDKRMLSRAARQGNAEQRCRVATTPDNAGVNNTCVDTPEATLLEEPRGDIASRAAAALNAIVAGGPAGRSYSPWPGWDRIGSWGSSTGNRQAL